MTLNDLRADLDLADIRGRDVLVHSSLSSLGYVEGGAQTVVHALTGLVAIENTILFPSHTWALALKSEEICFDVRMTPVMSIGAIPEAARLAPHALRSLHATHSVSAFGPAALTYTSGHEDCLTPCGSGSPYYRLADNDGLIVLLGCDNHSNTSIHMVEELLEVPGALEASHRNALLTGYDGKTIERDTRMHSFAERDFMRVDEPMTALGIQRLVMVGNATVRIIDAAKQREWLMQELQTNPSWLFC